VRGLPTVARFALASQVLPRLTSAIVEAEKIRTKLVSHSGNAPVFKGKDPETEAILSGHRHAFILPEANGRHGEITHVTLFARMGFDENARAAIEGLTAMWQRSRHDIQLVLLGVGHPEDFSGTRTEAGQCALFATSDTWVARTPFVPTRHAKCRRGGEPKRDDHGLVIGSPEHDLVRLLAEQGFPRPLSIERIPYTDLGTPTRWLAFRTELRMRSGSRPTLHGVGFRVRFPCAVQGPLAVGYGAHVGLGCFVPVS
jgi:CRISPR-associated protein Csb2